MRTVLVGFGKMADTMRRDQRMARYFPEASHAQVLSRHASFCWDAVVDPSQEARERARKEWGIETSVGDISELPAAETYTAAVLATPPGQRLAVLHRLTGLRAVLVEKPMGSTLDEAREFVETCARRGIVVQVNFWRRAVPMFQQLAKGGLEQAIGSVQCVFGLYGNGMRQNGSHLIDFLRMLCGEVESVTGAGSGPATVLPLAGDRSIACQLKLSSGATAAVLPVDFRHWREVSLDIWGTTGRLSVMQEGLTVTRYRRTENRGLENEYEIDNQQPMDAAVEVGGSLRAMYDTLAAAATGRGVLLCDGDVALRTERVLDTILATARA